MKHVFFALTGKSEKNKIKIRMTWKVHCEYQQNFPIKIALGSKASPHWWQPGTVPRDLQATEKT